MKRLIVWMWAIQVLMFVGAGFAWMFAPALAFHQLLPSLKASEHPIAVAGVQILAPFAVAMGLFTALGQMSSRPNLRRHFSALFALFLAPWIAVIYVNVYGPTAATGWSPYVLVFLAPGAVFLIPNAIVGFFSPSSRAPSATGFWSTAPRALFPFWVVQAIALIAVAVALVFAPRWVLETVVPARGPHLEEVDLAQFRTIGPYAACMGLFALYGTASIAWVEVWTSIARIFAVLFSLLALAFVLVYEPWAFHARLLALAVVCVILAVVNLVMVRYARRDALEGVHKTKVGWTPLDLVAGPAMMLQTLTTKRRASHLVGVGARGRFTVVPEPRFPESHFFRPGKEFPVQMRFANLTELDDASLDVRGAALKLSSEAAKSPFDTVLNTGAFTPASHIVGFAAFVLSKFIPTFGSKIIVASNRPAREGGIAGLRRAPSSYAALHYYGQIVRIWIDIAQQVHLVRYRLVPVTPGPEPGLPDKADCSHIWERGRRPDDNRPVNYLRAELRERLAGGRVELRFQAQFHRAVPGESLSWYDAGVDWEEDEHPWLDVGRVVLEAALPDRETEVLRFNPGNRPECLDTPIADGILDPRSMGDSEMRVMARLQRIRMALYSAFGLPSFEPEPEPMMPRTET
jgi:hypothetical protein